MFNLLSKLRPSLSGADAPAQLAALHSRREAANKEAAEAQAAFEDTVQRAVASECSWDDVAKAKAALTDAEGAAAALAQAAELAEKHQEAAQHAAAVDRAWAATVEACREREVIATRLQGRIEKAAADYAQLIALNAKVHRALPTGLPARDMESFSIAADLAPSLVRVEYSRRGLPGGPHLMGAEHQLLADRYKVATVCAERARAGAQGVDNG